MSLNFKYPDAASLLAGVFAYYLGCYVDDLECMQNKTTKEILQAADSAIIIPLDISSAVMKWAPVVTSDSNFPQQPLSAFEKGEIVNVPFCIGSNYDDGVLFGYAISPKYMPSYEYIAIISGIFHDEYVPTVLEHYPPVYEGDNREICSRMLTDYLFGCPSRYTARLAEKAGFNQTYLYLFSRNPVFCPWPDSQKFCCNRSCHGDEMAYAFRDSGYPFPWNLTGGDLYLANSMSSFWQSFAHFGDPNKFNVNVTWPLYRTQSDLLLQMDIPLKQVPNYNKAQCDVWDTIGYYHAEKVVKVLQYFKTKKVLKK